MTPDPWTSGELQRAVENLQAAVSEGMNGLNRRFDGLDGTFVRKDVYETVVGNLDRRLTGAQRWVYGIVLAMITAGLSGGGVFLLRGHP